MEKSSRHKQHVVFMEKNFNPKLRRMLQILLFVSLVLVVYVIYSAIANHANPWFVLSGFIIGIGIGIFFARMFKISWDEHTSQVVYRMDIIGVILLIAFIIFDINRSVIVADFISAPNVKTTSYALLAGIFYGRVVGTGRSIVTVLRTQKILPPK